MKTIKYIFIGLVSASLLYACGSNTDYAAQITEKRKQIESLEDEIRELEKQDTTIKKDEYLSKVVVTPVEKGVFESYLEVHGVVESNQNVQVMPEQSGVIKEIRVKEGQNVKKGTVLAVLDTELMRKSLAELETSLSFAEELFQKQKNLREQNIGTEVQYLEAKNRKEGLDNSVASLKAQIAKAYITAPIEGTIDDIVPKVGEMASPSLVFARIINTKDVYITTQVSESFIGKIKSKDQVEIEFPSFAGKHVKGKVIYVGSYIHPNNRTFTVHVSIDKNEMNLIPNLLSIVKFKNEIIEDIVVVPTKVIQEDSKHAYVFTVVDNQLIRKNIIEKGSSYNGITAIKGGLEPGELLVVKGQTAVVDGKKVSVEQQ